MSRWDLPVPESPIKAERLAFLHPLAGLERVDDGRVDVAVGVDVERAQRLLLGEHGGFDAPLRASTRRSRSSHSAISSSARNPEVGHLFPAGRLGLRAEVLFGRRRASFPLGGRADP